MVREKHFTLECRFGLNEEDLVSLAFQLELKQDTISDKQRGREEGGSVELGLIFRTTRTMNKENTDLSFI